MLLCQHGILLIAGVVACSCVGVDSGRPLGAGLLFWGSFVDDSMRLSIRDILSMVGSLELAVLAAICLIWLVWYCIFRPIDR